MFSLLSVSLIIRARIDKKKKKRRNIPKRREEIEAKIIRMKERMIGEGKNSEQ